MSNRRKKRKHSPLPLMVMKLLRRKLLEAHQVKLEPRSPRRRRPQLKSESDLNDAKVS
jgi:hypothetical protein